VRLAVALFVLAGCGRIGFTPGADADPPPADAPPDAAPGTVTVTVTGRALDTNAGQPVADAYVVFVGADQPQEVVRTDANGLASTFVTGATTVHVAHLGTPAGSFAVVPAPVWRVTSFDAIGGGATLVVGAPPGFGALGMGSSVTVNLPVLAGATSYELIGPGRCQIDGVSAGPSFPRSYGVRCDGDTVRLYAVARTPTTTSWLDAGDVMLAPGAVISPTASWQPTATHRIAVDGIADGATVSGGLLEARGPDDALLIGSDEVVSSGGTAMIAFDGLSVAVDQIQAAVTSDPFSLRLVRRVAPPEVSGVRSLAATVFSRAIDSLFVDRESGAMGWTYGPPAQTAGEVVASIHTFDTSLNERVEWFGYHPAATTAALLPGLPPPLDTLRPATGVTITGGAMVIAGGGGDYAQAVARIDRDFSPYLNEIPLGAAISIRFLPGETAREAPRPGDWIDRGRAMFTVGE